jgi:hypothetical protein
VSRNQQTDVDIRLWSDGDLPRLRKRSGNATSGTAGSPVPVAEGKHRFIHAFPSIDNGPSNAICHKVGSWFVSRSHSATGSPFSGSRL